MNKNFILKLFFLLAFARPIYAEPFRLYEIYNPTPIAFESREGESDLRCLEFTKIPANQKLLKVIDFKDSYFIICKAIAKNHPDCGLDIKLIPRFLLEVVTFGSCNIRATPRKNTERIDKLFIQL